MFTSYLYPDEGKPRYVLAMSVNSAFALAAILITLLMRVILQRANKKLEQGEDVSRVMKGEAHAEIAGLSAAEQLERKQAFRYIT